MRQITKTLNDFAMWTGAGGIPNLGRAKSISMRLFWGIIFAVCFVLCFYQTSIQIEKYLSFPFNIQTYLHFETLKFPAVTVCHLNPYKKSAILANPNLTALLDGFNKAVTNQLTQEEDQWNFLRDNQTFMGKQTTARNSILFNVAAMSPLERQRISYSQEELISRCSFGQRPCGQFKAAFYPSYGNCFTFNPDAELKSTRTGPGYGLRMMLITDTTEYLPFTESAGVRITVTGKDDAGGTTGIFPNSEGCNAGTGFATSFTVQFLESRRLGPPYSECAHPNSGYSLERCIRECMQRYVYSKCHCSAPTFDAAPGTEYCTVRSADCISDALAEFRIPPNDTDSRASQCGCYQPCKAVAYKVLASTSAWPSKPHEAFNCGGMSLRQCREWHAKNALAIEVYYERMNFQSIVESETYTLTSLVSDFGGNVGLWIGFSVITGVEVLFLPLILCLKCWRRRNFEEAVRSLGAIEIDYSDERDNDFDKVGGDHDPPPPFGGDPFEFRKPIIAFAANEKQKHRLSAVKVEKTLTEESLFEFRKPSIAFGRAFEKKEETREKSADMHESKKLEKAVPPEKTKEEKRYKIIRTLADL